MAERSLDAASSTRGGEHHQVVTHVDVPVLVHDADGRCALADGPALAPKTARRLACDAALVTMVDGPDGTILETTPIRAERVDGRIEAANAQRGLAIAANTCTPKCYGDPLDLDRAVAGLCETRERAAP